MYTKGSHSDTLTQSYNSKGNCGEINISTTCMSKDQELFYK